MNVKVKLFVLENCPYCEKLITLLDNANIEHDIINLGTEAGYKQFEPIYELSKSESFPTIVIGETILVPDVSFKTIDMAFKLIQLFLNKESI